MYDLVLHTGLEHPNLLWIVVASSLSFLAGLGVGGYLKRTRIGGRDPEASGSE